MNGTQSDQSAHLEINRGAEEEAGITDIFDSVVTTVKENPIASMAIGAAVLVLATTPAGKIIRPAISLAVSSGAASALANAALKRISKR